MVTHRPSFSWRSLRTDAAWSSGACHLRGDRAHAAATSSLLKNGSVAEGLGSGSRSRSENGVESPDSPQLERRRDRTSDQARRQDAFFNRLLDEDLGSKRMPRRWRLGRLEKQTAGGRPPAVCSLVIHHIPAAPHARARRTVEGRRRRNGSIWLQNLEAKATPGDRPAPRRTCDVEKATASAFALAVATHTRNPEFVWRTPFFPFTHASGELEAKSAQRLTQCRDAAGSNQGRGGRYATARRRRT